MAQRRPRPPADSSIMTTEVGCTRFVILTGSYAIKIPQFKYEWRHFLLGLLANMQEATFSKTKWPELCPVTFSVPGGWLIVMRRARRMTRDEWDSFDPDKFRFQKEYTVPVEAKLDSFGWLDGRVVAIDYGGYMTPKDSLPDSEYESAKISVIRG